jgi:hypothetical protein
MYDPATARSVFLRSQPPRLVPEGGIPGRDYIETKLNYFSSTVDGERPFNRRYPSEDLPETNILFEEREERVYECVSRPSPQNLIFPALGLDSREVGAD